MAQTRIVLNPKHKPKAEEILEATGIESLSQLFTILVVNYGDVLIAALKAQPQMQAIPATPSPNIAPLQPSKPSIAPVEQPAKVFKPMEF